MKFPVPRIAVLAFSIATVSLLVLARLRPDLVPDAIRSAIPSLSNVKSFEFLGCSGDWLDDKMAPKVWKAESKSGVKFLFRHPADCGYTIGTNPRAILGGASADFSYKLSNDSGALAACTCEYWAAFELRSGSDKIESISLNGRKAQAMGDLREH